jgi:O-antigen ligase
MIRLTLLTLFVTFLCLYAWKDWYKSLCGLILLMAVIEHPDMPRTLLGIQGLNPWNLVMVSVLGSWFVRRKEENLTWDMPRHVTLLFALYMVIVLVGVFRMLGDREGLLEWASLGGLRAIPSTSDLVSEHLVNTLKWVVPGLLLFHGCRSRERALWAVVAIVGVYVLLAVQVIKWMPLSSLTSGSDLEGRSSKILRNEVGYHRVNLSMMLAGASWAIFCTRTLVERPLARLAILGVSFMVLFAQMLTGGRTGYATWGAVGLVILFLRWRSYFLLAPIVAVLLIGLVPAAKERMLQGFAEGTQDTNVRLHGEDAPFDTGPDLYTITAGRNVAWPYVIEKIEESPMFGFGREAMQRTGLSVWLWTEFGESFPHPHSAYLQLLLDNGIIGALPIFIFYAVVVRQSIRLLRDRQNALFVAVGGVTLSLTLALLVASFGSQSFYPEEGVVPLWCAIGLMLRAHVERSLILAEAEAAAHGGSPDLYGYSQVLGERRAG